MTCHGLRILLFSAAMSLGALFLKGCSNVDCTAYASDTFLYGTDWPYSCPSGSDRILQAERCECAAMQLSAGWDGPITRDDRPTGCYRYKDTGANINLHAPGASASGARPICAMSPAPPPPTTTKVSASLSSCCQNLLALEGGRRLDGPLAACTRSECESAAR
eukprot:TRINITY_DN34558_c0_g1_i1.p1 TRINITY_DN34558_c0_g1~~TRINITY_DN34558_c0_g1_i1.p1  ORF type:complete len:163 (-),score=18.91 TRINITY_DN34558_c0_g1_i1:31-519(-)